MKRDFGTILLDIEGQPLKATSERHLTLGEACATALLNTYEDDARVSGEEKVHRHTLASLVYQKKWTSVTSEQIALMKTYLARAYGPVVVGPAYQALESDCADPKQG